MPKGFRGFQKGHKSFVSKRVYKEISIKLKKYYQNPKHREEKRQIALKRQFGKINLGRKMPEKTKVALLKANLGRKKINPTTTTNKLIRSSRKYKLWRKSVFERDNYICVICKIKNKKGVGRTIELHPDHIKPFSLYPLLRFNVSNGRTLCADCHRKTDTYGTKVHNYKKHL